MRLHDSLYLEPKLTRAFIYDHWDGGKHGELQINVGSEFAVEILADAAALWWVEHMRRGATKIHVNFDCELPSEFPDDAKTHFLTTSFGYSLVSMATSVSIRDRPVNKNKDVLSRLQSQYERHADQLTALGQSCFTCRMPFTQLPRPLRVVGRNNFSTYDRVKASLTHNLLGRVIPTQRVLGLDDAVEFFFQAMKNAYEEHLQVEKMGVIGGCYGVILRRFRASECPPEVAQIIPPERPNTANFSLSVVDLGRGIPAAIAEYLGTPDIPPINLLTKAFEPGFTTKGSTFAEQTPGLGLSRIANATIVLDGQLIVECPTILVRADIQQAAETGLPAFVPIPMPAPACFGTSMTLVWQDRFS